MIDLSNGHGSPPVLVVAHSKGGVGKTTLATNLAVEAARRGRRVLLVDTDPQSSATLFADARGDAAPTLRVVQLIKPVVHRQLPQLIEGYDLAVVDAGGRDSSVFRSALAAASDVLIPLPLSAYDVWAIDDVLAVVGELAAQKDDFHVGVVLNQVLPRKALTRAEAGALEALADSLAAHEGQLLTSRIHSRTAWRQAAGEGRSVTEWEPKGAAAAELVALAQELGL